MDCGLPILNCLLQHTLRNFCTSSNWVYSIFWRILPRNYPPPKWEHGGSVLDRVKGNKRNWILVWEDGFCDFIACQGKGGFGADIFFKMSHEVYNYGEGLVGKVAADNNYKWVFQDSSNEIDPNFIFSRNAVLDYQPKSWEAHFNSGIQTIAIISVREGIIQLGSFDKVAEDLNMVTNIQRKFNYLQSIPGMYEVQRPSISKSSSISMMQIQYPLTLKPNNNNNPLIIGANETDFLEVDEKRQLVGSKRLYCDRPLDDLSNKSINLGYHNISSSGPSSLWSIPPLFPWTPTYPCTTTATINNNNNKSLKNLSPFLIENVQFNTRGVGEHTSGFISRCSNNSINQTVDASCKMEAANQDEDKVGIVRDNVVEMESKVIEKRFTSQAKAESAIDLN